MITKFILSKTSELCYSSFPFLEIRLSKITWISFFKKVRFKAAYFKIPEVSFISPAGSARPGRCFAKKVSIVAFR